MLPNFRTLLAAALCLVGMGAALRAETGQAQDQQALADELAKLRDRITALEKEPDWPAGPYCIFRSGKCPAGFKGQQGRMAAIRMYHGGDTSYLKTMRFGNSSIRWHNSVAATWNGEYWLGEPNFSVSCKAK